MSNVLLVSYPFPPSATVGVSRALAYVRYLRRFGCQISVLTATAPQTSGYDPQLIESIPNDVSVFRAWNPEIPFAFRDRVWKRMMSRHLSDSPKNREPAEQITLPTDRELTWIKKNIRGLAQRLLFPDPQLTWIPFAVRTAARAIRSHGIDTVILNSPPFSTLRIGMALKLRFPELRIITDFRDEWVGYYLTQIDDPSEDRIRRAEDLERQIVRASSYVSTVTEAWVDRLRLRYPQEPREKFICTPNGYEPEAFLNFQSRQRTDGKMLMTYFGSVHPNRVYSPHNYLEAITSLPAAIRDRILTRFIGRVRPDAEQQLNQTTARVEQLGFLPKPQGLKYLEETDVLLLIATDPTSHAGKLFEYLATGKPILALSPLDGEIAKVLRQTRAGWCVDPWDRVAIQKVLLQLLDRLDSGERLSDPDWKAIQAYSWPNIFCEFCIHNRNFYGDC